MVVVGGGSMQHNPQLYRPLVEDPEEPSSSSSSGGSGDGGGTSNKSYGPDDDCCDHACGRVLKKVCCCCGLCGKLAPVLEKVFCCCGRCWRLPCCPPLKRAGRWTKERSLQVKGFLCQSSNACYAAWLFAFLFGIIVFGIIMATALAQVNNPYD